MKVEPYPKYPSDPGQTIRKLTDLHRELSQQLNQLTEGAIAALHNAATAAPTTGTWKQGDRIAHSAPVEAGSSGSKYVITGFRCVASGTPGTWVQERVLTGS